MNTDNKLYPGPLAQRGHKNIISIIIGAILIIIGLFFILSSFNSESILGILLGLLLITGGGYLCHHSASSDADMIYCEKGFCRIMDGNYKCTGGCNKCVFAYRYLTSKGSPYDENSVFFQNTGESNSKKPTTIESYTGNDDTQLPKSEPAYISNSGILSFNTTEIPKESSKSPIKTEEKQPPTDEEINRIMEKAASLLNSEVSEKNLPDYEATIKDLDAIHDLSICNDNLTQITTLRMNLKSAVQKYGENHGPNRYRMLRIIVENTEESPLVVSLQTQSLTQTASITKEHTFKIKPIDGRVVTLNWRSKEENRTETTKVKKGLVTVPRTFTVPIWHSGTFKENTNWPDELVFEFQNEGNRFRLANTDVQDFIEKY